MLHWGSCWPKKWDVWDGARAKDFSEIDKDTGKRTQNWDVWPPQFCILSSEVCFKRASEFDWFYFGKFLPTLHTYTASHLFFSTPLRNNHSFYGKRSDSRLCNSFSVTTQLPMAGTALPRILSEDIEAGPDVFVLPGFPGNEVLGEIYPPLPNSKLFSPPPPSFP